VVKPSPGCHRTATEVRLSVLITGFILLVGCAKPVLNGDYKAPSKKWKVSFADTAFPWRRLPDKSPQAGEVDFFSTGGAIDFVEYAFKPGQENLTNEIILERAVNAIQKSARDTGRRVSVANAIGASLIVFEHLKEDPDKPTEYFGIFRSNDIYVTMECEIAPASHFSTGLTVNDAERDCQTIASSFQFFKK
jgi:hypothetical protein